MTYTVRPLSPEARARLAAGRQPRVRSPFDSTWTQTLELLRRETWNIAKRRDSHSGEFVMMLDVEDRHIRNDGELRANATPDTPDVGIWIETRHAGDLLLTCGRFRYWHDNVRAIALGLEALRRVDRYGITQSDEQYRGWQALPPGTPMPAARMTVEDAARLLCDSTMVTIGEDWHDVVAGRSSIRDLYREAIKTHHPDHGGDAEMFRRLTEARDLLLEAG